MFRSLSFLRLSRYGKDYFGILNGQILGDITLEKIHGIQRFQHLNCLNLYRDNTIMTVTMFFLNNPWLAADVSGNKKCKMYLLKVVSSCRKGFNHLRSQLAC